jgi:uncharacterized protein DUF1016
VRPYGEKIVSTLSRQLHAEFGNGFSRPNLFRMVRFLACGLHTSLIVVARVVDVRTHLLERE